MRTRITSVTLLMLLTVGLSACEVEGSVGSGARVPAADLETEVSTKIKEQLQTDSVTCPDDLRGKVGATATCTVVADDLRYTATVTATQVEGTDVSFDIKVPPPATLMKEALEKRIAAALADQTPGGVKAVRCQSDLVGTVGETASCTVTPGSDGPIEVTATVTSADFLNVEFRIRSSG